VLAHSEDLNKVIKNVRECFGYPYPESIAYYNVISGKFRIRREHEHLVDVLKQWCMMETIDAIVWIDYPKTNQKPAEFSPFMQGPRTSVPFSQKHLTMPRKDVGHDAHSDDESDLVDEVPPAKSPVMGHGSAQLIMSIQSARHAERINQLAATFIVEGMQDMVDSDNTTAQFTIGHENLPEDPSSTNNDADAEKSGGQISVQPEVVPPHGSIYPRSIAPGPGQYAAPSFLDENHGRTFLGKYKSHFDKEAEQKLFVPGPGKYEPLTHTPRVVSFNKGRKLVHPTESTNAEPFVSAEHAAQANRMVHGPGKLHNIPLGYDDERLRSQFTSPRYVGFTKARRM
jgi:hypothetical protein